MSLFRPAVVSEFQKTKVSSIKSKWQYYKALTWIASCGGGLFMMFGHQYKGNSSGQHALSGLQNKFSNLKDAIVTGDWSLLESTSTEEVPRKYYPAPQRTLPEAPVEPQEMK